MSALAVFRGASGADDGLAEGLGFGVGKECAVEEGCWRPRFAMVAYTAEIIKITANNGPKLRCVCCLAMDQRTIRRLKAT